MAKAKNSEKAIKPNIFMRIGLFIKQIIDELRKVVFDQQGTVLLVPRRVYLRAAADGTGHRHGLRSGQADPVDIRLINNLKVKVHD